jgi:N-acetylglucosamine repressor
MKKKETLAEKESVVDIKQSKLKKKILRQIYDNGPQTIAQLSKYIHASVPSVAMLINILLDEKWIIEIGTENTQFGRKPMNYGINPDKSKVLVIDINTHDTKIIVFNMVNEIIYSHEINLQIENNNEFVDKVIKQTYATIQDFGLDFHSFLIIGVSIPGLMDSKTGASLTYRNLNLPNKTLGKRLEEVFGIPVHLIHDTKATMMGEFYFGLAKGKKDALSVFIDWGVGLGILINSEIYQGSAGFAGELGHVQIRPDGELCHCGKIGCIDTVTSASALIKQIKNGLKEGRATILSTYKDNLEEIDIKKIVDVSNQGDLFAIDLLYNIGYELGKGLGIAVHLLNPEIIIINGVLAKAEKYITNPIEQAINKYCLSDFKNNLEIKVSQLGEQAKFYGTLAFVMNKVLENK